MTTQTVLNIQKEDDVVVARQLGRGMAQELGFGLADQTRLATAISELARNVLQYAKSGRLELHPLGNGTRVGVEVIISDDGPGIDDVSLAMQDGFTSRTGSLGAGLPGARRLAHEFELSTRPTVDGTVITLRMWRN